MAIVTPEHAGAEFEPLEGCPTDRHSTDQPMVGALALESFSEAVTSICGQSHTWRGHADDRCTHDTGKPVTSITYFGSHLGVRRDRLMGRSEDGCRDCGRDQRTTQEHTAIHVSPRRTSYT